MASKNKEVRIQQREKLEKQLALRLQKLAEGGIDGAKAQKDPTVKNLKSQIRETNVRIATIDKSVKLNNDMAEAKARKLAEKEAEKAQASADAPPEKKSKKKAAAEPEAAKKPRKKKEEPKA
ncbi:MAG: hypothetical protein R6W75_05635 [Smithellaceae bacterium]